MIWIIRTGHICVHPMYTQPDCGSCDSLPVTEPRDPKLLRRKVRDLTRSRATRLLHLYTSPPCEGPNSYRRAKGPLYEASFSSSYHCLRRQSTVRSIQLCRGTQGSCVLTKCGVLRAVDRLCGSLRSTSCARALTGKTPPTSGCSTNAGMARTVCQGDARLDRSSV